MSTNPDASDRSATELQQAYQEFKQSRFYRWCDSILVGKYHWLILPLTGFIDAFVIILPTEAVLGMYLLRDKARSVLKHTLWVSLFATFGYVILALIASVFGEPFGVWFADVIGENLNARIDGLVSSYIIFLAITAGLTSVFPMPATAFAVVVGLTGAPILPFAIGTFVGKGIRFGLVGYVTQRYGAAAFDYYMKHVNVVSIVLVILVLVYLTFKYLT